MAIAKVHFWLGFASPATGGKQRIADALKGGKTTKATWLGDYHLAKSLSECPEQKQPNEKQWNDMEVGSSLGKIDNNLIIRVINLL